MRMHRVKGLSGKLSVEILAVVGMNLEMSKLIFEGEEGQQGENVEDKHVGEEYVEIERWDEEKLGFEETTTLRNLGAWGGVMSSLGKGGF